MSFEDHGSVETRREGAAERDSTERVEDSFRPLETRNPVVQALMSRAEVVARSSAPAILLGETGAGKEVLARTIHRTSPRATGPFVPVNCGAIPGDLLESELFGHVRGAFSGAVADKAGLFHAASGGTLLLDEVADLPPSLQVKLLRVLQDGEVRSLGSTRSRPLDVRVIAATHKDLDALVRQGTFRADLFYRLNVFSLRVPPLRERREDILPLARKFLAGERKGPRRLSPVAEATLLAYGWPGNVRELSNAMRYAAAVAEGEVVELQHLPEELFLATIPPAPRPPLPTLAQVERDHILGVLGACQRRPGHGGPDPRDLQEHPGPEAAGVPRRPAAPLPRRIRVHGGRGPRPDSGRLRTPDRLTQPRSTLCRRVNSVRASPSLP